MWEKLHSWSKLLLRAENEASEPSIQQNSMWLFFFLLFLLCHHSELWQEVVKDRLPQNHDPARSMRRRLPVAEAHRWSWIPSDAGRFWWASSPASAPLKSVETERECWCPGLLSLLEHNTRHLSWELASGVKTRECFRIYRGTCNWRTKISARENLYTNKTSADLWKTGVTQIRTWSISF